ncbi:La-related protein 6 [Hordeum vulgare]|nr:La-related protein 6 [Hordeum vulgare]
MDLRSFYAIETLFSFLKETFYGGGLGSLAPKSDLTDQDKGTHYGCYKGKHSIHDIEECTLGTTNSKWKEPIHDKCLAFLHLVVSSISSIPPVMPGDVNQCP